MSAGAVGVARLAVAAQAAPGVQVSAGDTAWLLSAAALVMFMTPGLAFFYGGLVRAKNVLATIMYSFAALALVTIVWTLIGHTLAFGPDVGALVGKGGWIGGLDFVGFRGVGAAPHPLAPTVPHLAYAIYQMMFAIITPALISGAFAERMRFPGYLAFTGLWAVLVYAPLAHWVWGGGFLGPDGVGALDFAGGTVVHLNAGVAALAAALVVGRRQGWPQPAVPHNVPFVVLGASMLWFGWFGFNAGSALTAGPLAASAFTATQLATAAAVFGWMIPEWVLHGRPTTVGAASGAVAGLVAITPASGYVRPWAALVIGLVAGFVCEVAVGLKQRLRYDDALDVVAVHGVGGAAGALLTGVFATTAVNPAGAQGLVYGNPAQVGRQAVAVGVTLVWSFVVSFAVLKLVERVVGLRVSAQEEAAGLDYSQHAEAGYTFAEFGGAAPTRQAAPRAAEPAEPAAAGSAPAEPRIALARNLDAGRPGAPAYLVRVQGGAVDARLPVWREPRPDDPHGREAYWTELFGVRLERANLPALERALRQLLGELLPSGEPPRYLLRLPDRPPLPVFEEGGRLRLALGERRVEGADLSELRAAASAPATGPDAPAGGSPGGPWPHVLLFDRDLHGTDPVAVLRDGQVWLPVFAEAAGLLRTRAAGQRLDAAGDLDGMLALREQAARRLADAGKLHDPDDLAVTALAPETWARWSARLERVGELWVSLAVPPPTVHRSGRGYLAAVQDPDGTVALWCGRDRFDLTARVQRGMGRFILT